MRTQHAVPASFAALLLLALSACQPSIVAPTATPTRPSASPEVPVSTSSAPAAVSFQQSTLIVRQAPASNHHLLSPVDPATGLVVEGYEPIDMGSNFFYAFSPDLQTLIFSSYEEQEGSFASVRFLDLTTWTEATGLLLPTRGWTSAKAVSADGSRFAMATVEARSRRVWLVDAAKRILLESYETPLYVTAMAFTADGQALMLYGNPENFETGLTQGPPRAELRSAQDLDLIWSRDLDAVVDGFVPNAEFKGEAHQPGTGSTYRPAIVFDPLDATMYVVHADVDRLTRVEFGRKRVLTQDILPAVSWVDRLLALGAGTAHAKIMDGIERKALLAPDAGTLYITGIQNKMTESSAGNWEFEQLPLPLTAVSASSAAVLWTSEASGTSLQFSEDVGSLFVSLFNNASEEMQTAEVNPSDGVVLNEAAGLQMQLTRRMDGTPLLVATEYGASAAATLSAFTLDGVPLGEWSVPRYGDWILIP